MTPKRYSCLAEALEDFAATLRRGLPITPEQRARAYTHSGSLPKDLALMHWQSLQLEAQPEPLAVMDPIPAKASGSTYGACGVRIDGSPEFVDSVLARLKCFLPGENGVTRLGFSRSKVKPKEIAGKTKGFENSASGAECVYIRLHQRGVEAQMAHAFLAGCRRSTDEEVVPLFE